MNQEDWNQAKEKYQKQEIAEELSFVTEQALYRGKKKWRYSRTAVHILTSAAAFFLCFIIGINTSTAFAGMIYDIPMLGKMARLFTFTSYEEENDESYLSVSIPEIKNTGNSELEDRVNQEIRLKMSEVIKEAEERAKENQQAFLDTGGDPKDIWRMEITIDYELKCSTEEQLSFVIWKSESYGNFALTQYFYNIDLKTGEDLTLRDLLGPNYQDICNRAVQEGIEKRKAEDEQAFFYGDSSWDAELGFTGISEDQTFYLNEHEEVVLVFDKYSIAPGYMGILEFTVPAQR